MGWFTRIDNDLLDWEITHWKWLMKALQPEHDIGRIRLVQPTPADFPVVAATADDRADKTFRCVQQHFGLAHWPCKLQPFEELHDILRETLPVLAQPEHSNGAAGLFEVTQERDVIIHYKREQLGDPVALIATMAHELCHYVLATIPDEPPCGWDDDEPLTDLAAVFFGFGIFQANSSFRFSQWRNHEVQGWKTERQGYLSEQALSLALALFCADTDTDPAAASQHLSTNPRHYFQSYYKELLKKHSDAVNELKEIRRKSESADALNSESISEIS
ncbi:MAG: hypothetical protein WCJ02_17235 [bacterium]